MGSPCTTRTNSRRHSRSALRRTKYGDTVVGSSYFKFGMDYFRRRFPGCLFLVVSDDPAWCEETLLDGEDIFLVASYAAADLAILASCQHVVMSYGTFGFWGGFMAGGRH